MISVVVFWGKKGLYCSVINQFCAIGLVNNGA